MGVGITETLSYLLESHQIWTIHIVILYILLDIYYLLILRRHGRPRLIAKVMLGLQGLILVSVDRPNLITWLLLDIQASNVNLKNLIIIIKIVMIHSGLHWLINIQQPLIGVIKCLRASQVYNLIIISSLFHTVDELLARVFNHVVAWTHAASRVGDLALVRVRSFEEDGMLIVVIDMVRMDLKLLI